MISFADSALTAQLHPSPSFEPRRGRERADMIVLHYTGMTSAGRAIAWLADPASKVSCHYVVDEFGRITQMVAEGMRAWHAGVSWWAGESDINSASIGIEIHNPGHELGYPPFGDGQMAAVIALVRDIARRNGVPPWRVLGHSDVAPGRKIDPGERFDWRQLWREGVGHWVEPVAIVPGDSGQDPEALAPEQRAEVVRLLSDYGYRAATDPASEPSLAAVVRAFQIHFRPERTDGRVDVSTMSTLARLLDGRAAVA